MSATGEEGGGPPRTKWASEEDFNQHRNVITELYMNTTLPVLMHTMETQHGFFATPKMYKRRFRSWGLWKHDRDNSIAGAVRHGSQPYAAQSALTLVRRTPTPEPGDSFELRNEEMMYRVIRDYYDAAFSARRWVFRSDSPGQAGFEQDPHAHQLAVERTRRAFNDGQETWLRFRAALNLLERPSAGSNGGKEDDFAQGVRMMRVAFAELSTILSDCEPPLLFLWLLQVMMIFRESPARDFRPVEMQLLKHLHDLTSTTAGQPRHATALLWRTLWSGGRGIPRDRYHLRICTAIAIEKFTQYLGFSHIWTVDLSNFSIFTLRAAGDGDPEEKTTRYRTLLQRLEALGVYDDRHINVLCCWANHYWQHGRKEGNLEILREGIAMLTGILRDPRKAQALESYPGSGFNLYSILTSMYYRLEQWELAECYVRRAIVLAEIERAETGEDGDLFEGLIKLEMVLRAQGKISEADAVQEERKRLVKESLERVGEKEDSA
ncbi:Clr5 domain-containing protein [Madurella fahalii]|uniref:Clr5 domain-containing protein n=1 Tax=Madurella fahalii TaxID=1157608 RepID=A0ABQ0G4Y0_9PEZI